jgi:CubicO group peptidase (beta-lactamase class C family)
MSYYRFALVVLSALIVSPRRSAALESACKDLPVGGSRVVDRGPLGRAVDHYVDSIARTGVSGTILIAMHDTVKVSRGFGFADRERCIPNTPETLFDVGSIAKSFTAVGISQLIEKGRLREADSLSHLFAGVPRDKSGITVGELLTHTAGLQSFHNTGGDFEAMTREEALRRILRDSLRFTPGAKEAYSNSGYTLLAMILERASGTSWQRYLRDSLFRRAGIRNGWFWGEERIPRNSAALGYVANVKKGDPTEWPLTWASLGGAGIVMTVNDMFRFAKALDHGALLKPATERSMQKPALKKWAEGWEVSQTPYGKLVMKGGASEFGFTSQLRRYVDRGVTIILLLNSSRRENDYPHQEVGPGLSDVVFANVH